MSDQVIEMEDQRKQSALSKAGKAVGKNALKSVKVVGSVMDDFKAFLDRGNVVDLAVGLVMGTAFTAIVTSTVTDLFTPLIGLAIDDTFENSFVVLACPRANNGTGPRTTDCSRQSLRTVANAKSLGAVTWNYGNFIQAVINFMIISAIIFFFVKVYAATFRRKAVKSTRDCPFCFKEIPMKACKCCFCCSEVEVVAPPEEKPTKNIIRKIIK